MPNRPTVTPLTLAELLAARANLKPAPGPASTSGANNTVTVTGPGGNRTPLAEHPGTNTVDGVEAVRDQLPRTTGGIL